VGHHTWHVVGVPLSGVDPRPLEPLRLNIRNLSDINRFTTN
jgi:hypothetical protein